MLLTHTRWHFETSHMHVVQQSTAARWDKWLIKKSSGGEGKCFCIWLWQYMQNWFTETTCNDGHNFWEESNTNCITDIGKLQMEWSLIQGKKEVNGNVTYIPKEWQKHRCKQFHLAGQRIYKKKNLVKPTTLVTGNSRKNHSGGKKPNQNNNSNNNNKRNPNKEKSPTKQISKQANHYQSNSIKKTKHQKPNNIPPKT